MGVCWAQRLSRRYGTGRLNEFGIVLADAIARWLNLGAVAQLGERLVRNEEVSGSIPLSSTNHTFQTVQVSPKASVNTGFLALYHPSSACCVH